MRECCGDIPDEILNEKVVGSSHLSGGDSQGSGKSVKKGIISKLGTFFTSGGNYKFVIYPTVLIFSVILLFFLKGKTKKE